MEEEGVEEVEAGLLIEGILGPLSRDKIDVGIHDLKDR